MTNQFNSDDEVLARWVLEAGDPSVEPDPQYAETLRAKILDRLSAPETVAEATPLNIKRSRQMTRIARLALAATILVAVGISFSWILIGGGSTSLALAQVAEALDNLRTATYEMTMEVENSLNGTTTTVKSKAWYLAPSLERVETSMSMGSVEPQAVSIMIMDQQAKKALALIPAQKKAMAMDLSKMKQPGGSPPNMFEMARQLIRDGSSGLGVNVESLGKKELDGRVVVGFRTRNNMADMTFWADPVNAHLVEVEIDLPEGNGHGVMSNFHYDIELDPSLFSLEPPADYTVEKMQLKMPVEDDLVNLLRFVAEHNDGSFPTAIAMNNKEIQRALQAASISESQKLINEPENQKLMKELQAQYGKDITGFMKAWMKEMEPVNQKVMKKMQERQQGTTFYSILQPESDSHYAGKGVKLDTPDRPIFWYRPTGAENYRVIYANLTVKEMSSDEVEKFPQSESE